MKRKETIHFIWCGGAVPDAWDTIPYRWEKMNPDKWVKRWGDAEISQLLWEKNRLWFFIFKAIRIPVKRADFARMCIIYFYGGWYVDHDLIPRRPLRELELSREIWYRLAPNSYESLNRAIGDYELILTREYSPIDRIGHGIANGIFFANQSSDVIRKFISNRIWFFWRRVLDSFGPWAFTRFLRKNVSRIDAVVLPPHYLLHEMFGLGDTTPLTFAVHPAENSWGDHRKEEFWKV